METIKAIIEEIDEKHCITINIDEETTRIPMSDDKASEVKKAFNKLISRLKEGEFQIKLEDVEKDLFSQVANEYITQLNREIQEVYGEMEHYGLIKE